jgi:hypothetical protein
MPAAAQPEGTPETPAAKVRNSLQFDGVTQSFCKTSSFFILYAFQPAPCHRAGPEKKQNSLHLQLSSPSFH